MGLGLLLSSCGKIPCTFSPTPTCNTQMEEGRRDEQEEQEGCEEKKSGDKKNSRVNRESSF